MIHVTATWWQCVFTGMDDDNHPQWPPSPWRLFAALTAGAHHLRDEAVHTQALAALKKIAATPPPTIWAPDAHVTLLPTTFVPPTLTPDTGAATPVIPTQQTVRLLDTSAMSATDNRQTRAKWRPGRVTMADPDVIYEIDDTAAPLTEDEVASLAAAARAVPYLGKASHIAELSVATAARHLPHHTRLRPTPGSGTRCWNTHTPAQLDIAHEAFTKTKATPVATGVFGREVQYKPSRSPRDAFTAVVPMHHAAAAPTIPSLMEHLTTVAPDADVMPLPQVGYAYTTGACAGIAILNSAPKEANRTIAALGAALPWIHPNRPTRNGWTLNPRRWEGPATTWYSATPVLAHNDKRVSTWQVTQALREAFDSKLEVVLTSAPTISGQRRWPNRSTRGERLWWAHVRTEEPITGPIRIGALPGLGYGLLAPVWSRT